MKGILFDIQRYSSHDGPGIRTTVFFKGCSLRCRWCHNPESFGMEQNILFHKESCIGCGRCALVCPKGLHTVQSDHVFLREDCIGCGACAQYCVCGALETAGREYAPEEVWRIISRDLPFYGESGGVTLSGGEVLLQADFAAQLLQRCKQAGIHTAVDTAGFVSWEAFEKVQPWTDLYLYDVKAVTPGRHKQATGQDNRRILGNYTRLAQSGARIWVRIPVVPGYTASREELQRIGEFLRSREPECVELLRFHRMAESKYRDLGLEYAMGQTVPPSMEDMEVYRSLLAQQLRCEVRLG